MSPSLPATLGPVRESPRRNREDMICRKCPELPLRNQCPHSQAGRLYLAQLPTNHKAQVPRAPQRCTKCPNRPLRSQCQHTQAGQAFLREQAVQAEVAQSMPPLQPQAAIIPTVTQAPSLTNSAPNPLLPPQFAARIIPFDEEQLDPALRQPQSHCLSPMIIAPPSPTLGTVPTSEVVPHEPTAENTTNTPIGTPSHTPQRTPDSSRNAFMSGSSTTSLFQSGSSSSLDTPSRSPQKQPHATKGNPYHGFVKGTMRGVHQHEIFQRHKRPSPLADSKDASKTFLDKINRLVERAKNISVKTGCWLFVGAQHPGAVRATIHYTSPRLLRDAPEDMDVIVNEYHQLMSNLLQARRAEALDLAKKYQLSVSENQTMATRVADLEAQMTTMKHAIEV